ncbi:Putative HD/PDEase domain, 5'-deoxynucleotidase YfbR/HDDC2 [Septoria linicola]|uniref:5'-deoxynucleotidase n=1 Tax=Septoria linicola TaxID=215465 RepID=A0A9Q9ASF1_9PEZI|nr:putative HD/PDEase domain, 5'-deoxynucleotidase YfbR/HDDC2 [Septoria linicola]USW54574.1 Putative HD/PDEase domain, 5'-deoxynucleotidase YfbR/HDDC2 [Septoria linicola]
MAPEAMETNGPLSPGAGILKRSNTNEDWSPSTVLSTLSEQPQPNSSSPVPFFHLLERLKTTKREGWRRFEINHGESISDHMYRMSIITMLCPPSLAKRIDVGKCTRMALIHDMAESLVGDITPVDGVSKTEKSRREADTMDYLTKTLLGNVHGGAAGQSMKEVWQEYEDSETLESLFVHDVDKMELLLQMIEYEKMHEGKVDLGEFSRVAKRIVLPEVQEWAAEVLKDREAFWKGKGKEPSGVRDISAEMQKAQDEYYGNGTS